MELTQTIFAGVILGGLSVVASITDLKDSKIYNWLTLPVIILGLVLNVIFGGWDGLIHSLLGIALGCGFLILGFFWGGIGAGDIKMMMGVGAVGGVEFVVFVFIYSIFLGAAYSLIILIKKRKLGNLFKNLKHFFLMFLFKRGKNMEEVKLEKTEPIKFGIFIALGTVFHFIEVVAGWQLLNLKI